MQTLEIEIRNPNGLHLRPLGQFVRTCGRTRSDVTIQNLATGAGPVNAKQMLRVQPLGVRMGHLVRITAEGEDEVEAIATIRAAIEAGLGEAVVPPAQGVTAPPTAGPPALAPAGPGEAAPSAPRPTAAPASPADPTGRTLSGVGAVAGIAVAPAWRYREQASGAAQPAFGDPREAIRAAAVAAESQLEALAARIRDAGRPGDAGIFEAQAVIATDPTIVDDAIARVAAGADPATAVLGAASEAATTIASLPDELLAARAADVRDVGARIARILRGETLVLPDRPVIAVADDLPPSVTAEIPAAFLLGIALAGGSRTAHAVILARGLGIPCVVGCAGLVEAVDAAAGSGMVEVALDGESGLVLIDPDPAARATLHERAEALAERRARAAAARGRPGATADGARILLVANIGSPDDATRALDAGAEGVGLFRTEFLFMQRQAPPAEEEQVAAYRRAFEAFGPERPVVVRLADIGGDKGIPYLGLPAEANPFLGVRAIRLAYRDPELLRTQLRAIWRAGGLAGVVPHVMAPMVATLEDVDLLDALRDEARAGVVAAGQPCAERMVTGIMVEIPAAALLAPELARRVAFFSIGTNDLTQYLMAADRGNAILARFQDALHPAVLRAIAGIVAGADAAGIPVAVCGELAGDPAGALVLVGLGVDELSADAGSLDEVRSALAASTRGELEELARTALAAPDAPAVRAAAGALLARGAGPANPGGPTA
ncbi:MAG TPA: phosphoenolpyruvate--protein phosphotransferase [Patescibacteria group bacterium]|nr:phosphoenolpyruvate--protein phosphotransferase [Patescibacteria group bacterium]